MIPHSLRLYAFAALSLAALLPSRAADSAPLSAKELAAKLSANQEAGSSYVRMRMDTPGTGTLQVQIKERRTREGTEAVCQVLYPKERKGEAVLLRAPGGSLIAAAGGKPRPLAAGQMSEGLFGSNLGYADLLENFFAWDNQTITGTEPIGKVTCQVLESKPGKGERSVYGSVRSWIDPRRTVALRVEKYGADGKLVRRIETTKVANDDRGHAIPANLSVTGRGGTATEVDGSRIKHDVNFSEREFSAEGLGELTVAHAGPE